MSVPEITPETLRAAADYMESRRYHDSAESLRIEVQILEREQADEQRINTLTQMFVDARRTANDVFHKWEDLGPNAQEALRAGIRAVIAAYDPEKRLTAPKPYDQGGIVPKPVRQWATLGDIPADVQRVQHEDHRHFVRSNSQPRDWIDSDDNEWHTGTGPFTEVTA